MDAPEIATYRHRIAHLRVELARRGAAGALVPLADEHGSEYVGSYAHRLRWLTGFTGTAGTAIVLPRRAALFTDGRYALQSREEVDVEAFDIEITPSSDAGRWISTHAERDAVVLYDPWLVSLGALRRLQATLRADIRLQPASGNVVDSLWEDRPLPPSARATAHGQAVSGMPSEEKRSAIARLLRDDDADAVVIAALDSVAWALNIRGSDIPHLPVVRAFLIVRHDESATLFVDMAKIGPDVRKHLGPRVDVVPYEAFVDALKSLHGRRVVADPDVCSAAIFAALSGSSIIETRDPCVLPRALKNDAEIQGARAAHHRDGVALTRFLCWLEHRLSVGPFDEVEAADRLLHFRQQNGKLREPSFATISAAGPNGALPHYVPRQTTARLLESGSLYLVDSGAQYDDGTTDVTRTIALGEPSEEMRRRFTQALRGHVAMANTPFPVGTTGGHIDVLARQFLWQGHADYASGTGHGVGSCLAVHEGPQYIGKQGGLRHAGEAIQARMILSIEPGFYLAGSWGIRIENLYLVVERPDPGGCAGWLGFDALTLAPIDRRLVDAKELSRSELRWLDQYHERVRRELSPHLSVDEAAWLAIQCAPM